MGTARTPHGVPTDNPRATHGRSTSYPQVTHGTPMGCSWSAHGQPMRLPPWNPYGHPSDVPRNPIDTPHTSHATTTPRTPHGLPTSTPLAPHGHRTGTRRTPHEHPTNTSREASVVRGHLTDTPRILHGHWLMGSPGGIHGLAIGCPRGALSVPLAARGLSAAVHAIPMGFLWEAHESSRGSACGIRGVPMERAGSVRGVSMGCAWDIDGGIMGCPWGPHESLIRRPLVDDGSPLGCLWVVCEKPMG